MIIDPAQLERRQLSGLINGLVAPRPIAWVSTVAPDGERNLAPFSFFNAFSFFPPTLGIGPGSRLGINKDSLRNIRESGEFVVNLVDESLARLANLCSAELEPEVDEWEVVGLKPADSSEVAPARIAASPASFECRIREIIDLGDPETPTNSLVVGTVLKIHVADRVIQGLTPIPEELRLVGRMGGDTWCRTGDSFELPRPGTTDLGELMSEAAILREELGLG